MMYRRKKRNQHGVLAASLLALGLSGCVSYPPEVIDNAQNSAEAFAAFSQEYDIDSDVYVPMADGTWASGHLYKPKGIVGPLPTILIRTHYDIWEVEVRYTPVPSLLDNGYAVLALNERGLYKSGGVYERTIPAPVEDGRAAIDWIIAQNWSDGNVGLFGCSSSAENQVKLLTARHPAIKAAVPMSAAVAMTRSTATGVNEPGQSRRGGAFWMGWIPWFFDCGMLKWPAPPAGVDEETRRAYYSSFSIKPIARTPDQWPEKIKGFPQIDAMKRLGGAPTEFEAYVLQSMDDPIWDQGRISGDDVISIPTLWMSSWFDYTPQLEIGVFEDNRRRSAANGKPSQHQLYVSAGFHCMQGLEEKNHFIGERNVGDARVDLDDILVEWFDAHMKEDETALANVRQRAAITVYDNGAREWRSFQSWPPQGAKDLKLYLSSQEGANSKAGDGRLDNGCDAPTNYDSYTYNSTAPVPSVGGGGADGDLGTSYKLGIVDQSEIETRDDVLVYSSDLLPDALTIAGNIRTRLYVSADKVDTDLMVNLTEVMPGGRSFNIAESALRLRYRDGADPSFLTPGEYVEVDIPTMVAAHTFSVGSRIRLQATGRNIV